MKWLSYDDYLSCVIYNFLGNVILASSDPQTKKSNDIIFCKVYYLENYRIVILKKVDYYYK